MRYYPNLDLLRFYAALCVLIAHVPDFAAQQGVTPVHMPLLDALLLGSQDAVTLFFTLSGFLITALLLAEQRKRGAVNVRAFWLRRALRIWPLYYLVICAVAILTPDQIWYGREILFYLVMLPNVSRAVVGLPSLLLGHLWSIGAEEQFYAIYPLFSRFRRRLPYLLIGFVVVKVTLTVSATPGETLHLFLTWNRFEAMALGGLAAWCVVERPQWADALMRPFAVRLIAIGVGAALVFTPPAYAPAYDVQFAALMAALILNLACNPRLVRIDTPFTRALGGLSYGVYMWHPLAIYIAASGAAYADLFLVLRIVAVTLAIAAGGYVAIERPFLNLKRRFMRVRTA
jgi:peptidoglycan/LPS O-acetylase OafA/YrhL